VTTVLPKATVQKANIITGGMHELEIVAVHLDSNENAAGDTLHEVHGSDAVTGRFFYWFETSDSLKSLFDVAVSNYIPQDDTEANVSVALGNG
jgi:hypothetical protein